MFRNSSIYTPPKEHQIVKYIMYRNTQHTSRKDAIITIRLHLATCFGRKRPSSGQLRTIVRYSKDSTQWDPISFTLKLNVNEMGLWTLKLNANEMGSHWVLSLLYLNIVLNRPEDGRLRPKHVAKCNLIVIIASCLDVCCVLTVHNILYNLIIHKGVASQKKNQFSHR